MPCAICRPTRTSARSTTSSSTPLPVGSSASTSSGRPDGATWLAWEAVRAVGADAVTIDRGDMLTKPPPGSDGLRVARVLAGRVLTDEGRELARLTDFDIDPGTGVISAIIVGDVSLPASALIGIGCYAIVVADPNTSRLQTLERAGDVWLMTTMATSSRLSRSSSLSY